MTANEFYSSTPHEINLRIQAYNAKYKQDIETNRITMAFAIASAFKGKDIKVFKNDDENKETNYISKEEKENELAQLKSMFRK